MSQKNIVNVAASVRQKLLNRARAEPRPFQSLAQLYAMERFLFRLGASPSANRFVLKGGLMTMGADPSMLDEAGVTGCF